MKRILYLQFTTPGGYTILGHGARILARRGWSVKFLGVDAKGNANKIQLHGHEGITSESLPYRNSRVLRRLNYAIYFSWAIWTALKLRCGVVYCSDRITAPIGLMLSRLGFHVVFHEHDPPHKCDTRFEKYLMSCRKRLAKRAVLCIVPNEERMQDFIRDNEPRNSMVVWNAVSLDEVVGDNKQRGDGKLRLWYQGALGKAQLPIELVDAVAQLPDVELAFVGYETLGNVGYADQITERAQELGCGERVQYLGTPASRSELISLARECDVGLALFKIPFRDPMAGASQKPFEYMALGMALLVPEVAEWQRFVIEPGYAIGCQPNDIGSLVYALKGLSAEPGLAARMGAMARAKVQEEWNYEAVFQPVVDLIEQACLGAVDD